MQVEGCWWRGEPAVPGKIKHTHESLLNLLNVDQHHCTLAHTGLGRVLCAPQPSSAAVAALNSYSSSGQADHTPKSYWSGQFPPRSDTAKECHACVPGLHTRWGLLIQHRESSENVTSQEISGTLLWDPAIR